MLRRTESIGEFIQYISYIQCTYSVHTLYIQCTYSIHTGYIQCTNSVLTVYIRCTYSLQTVYIQCTYGLRTVYIHCTYIVHTLYIKWTLYINLHTNKQSNYRLQTVNIVISTKLSNINHFIIYIQKNKVFFAQEHIYSFQYIDYNSHLLYS